MFRRNNADSRTAFIRAYLARLSVSRHLSKTARLQTAFFLLLLQFATCKEISAEMPKLASPVHPGNLGRAVNPFIGTGGISYLCANNFPGATVPFGLIRLSPDTLSTSGRRATNKSGYYYADPRILGFSHTRLAGTGAVDGGNFLIIPTTDKSTKSLRHGMNAEYAHENEIGFPGYYGISLPKLEINVELTATCRVGLHRYTFAENATPRFLVHVSSVLGNGESKNGEVRVLPEAGEIEGSVWTYGTFSKRYGGLKSYFVARFDRPFDEFGTWSGDADLSRVATINGNDVGVEVGFKPSKSARPIELRLAISHVSVANARENLEKEVGKSSFEQVLSAAVEKWEEIFSRIPITGGTEKQRTIFRTGVYHSFQMPTMFSDVNGDYLGFDRQTHQTSGFDYYTDMSLWDTFRTVHPLFNLIARREQRDMVVSLLKMAEQGGYLPRWPSGGGYTNSMFGTPADVTIAESYLKGIRDFDAESALQFMKKSALGPVPQGSRFSGRVGVEHYLKYGYCPSDLMKKSVASTIEYCYSDHAIARLAAALGHTDDARLFNEHARFYTKLFNPETQFFQPRDSHGQFAEFQPELMTYTDPGGKLTHAYVEGSAWQWRWGVPSDAAETVSLFKSREYFVQELNQFFEKSLPDVSVTPNSFYWHGNQPDIYAAFMFNAAGRPDLTQKWVRWILEKKYGDRENGIDGNDDGGTLSAWYVLASLGIYPTPGTDVYQICSPLWERAEVQIGDKRLTIVASPADVDHPYVKQVWLNEKPLDRSWIRHDEIAQGGTLRFELSAEPASREK